MPLRSPRRTLPFFTAVRLALGLAVLAPGSAWAAENAELELLRAKQAYDRGRYEQCLSRLERALEAPGQPSERLAQARMYQGLCHYGAGHPGEGVASFRLALSLNPALTLPRWTSPKLVDLFDYLRPPAPAKAAASSEEAAAPDVPRAGPALAPIAPSRSLATAALPPAAVARAPSRPSKRWAWSAGLGAGAAAGLGAGFYLGVEARDLQRQADSAVYQDDAHRLALRARQRATAANIAFAAAAGLAAAAVLTFTLGN